MLKQITEEYITVSSDKKPIYFKQPVLAANGVWGVDEFAVRSTSSNAASNAYKIFDDTSSLFNGLKIDEYVEFFSKTPLELTNITITSSDGYLAGSGTVSCSDNGINYTECGTWDSASDSKSATLNIGITPNSAELYGDFDGYIRYANQVLNIGSSATDQNSNGLRVFRIKENTKYIVEMEMQSRFRLACVSELKTGQTVTNYVFHPLDTNGSTIIGSKQSLEITSGIGQTYLCVGGWSSPADKSLLETLSTINVQEADTKTISAGKHSIWRLTVKGTPKAHSSYARTDMSQILLTTGILYYEPIDYTIPEGIAGRLTPYITYKPHEATKINLEGWFTYKQDDKININDTSDSYITGILESYATYRPHEGVKIAGQSYWLTYRMHEGVDIKDQQLYITYKQEDRVDSFKYLLGIGILLTPYILIKVNVLCGYINNHQMKDLAGIAISDKAWSFTDLQSINNIPITNNTGNDS